jgi:hypothetical protein
MEGLMTHQINRRKALTVVAAAPVAVAAFPSIALGEPGELANLIRKYWSEIDFFNTRTLGWSDEESDAFAAQTFEATLEQLIGVPARSADDAIAALEWVLKEGKYNMISFSWEPHGSAAQSLINAARDYLAGRAA